MIGTPTNEIKRPADSFLLGDKFIAHQLALNEVYCACHTVPAAGERAVAKWKIFGGALSPLLSLIPDAYCEIRLHETTRPLFLEVDLGTEGLTVWNKKIEQYLNFATSGEFLRLFATSRFAVLVVTNSEGRLDSLRRLINKITAKIFYLTTFDRMRQQGFWNSIWLRPEGKEPQSLI